MWNSLHRKHCSDEQLIAQLDGELRVVTSQWVKRHLNRCWDCRNRSHELETQTQDTARQLRTASSAQPDAVEAAKLKFLDRRQEFERGFAPQRTQRFGVSRQTAAVAATCVLITLLSVEYRRAPKFAASDILARIQREETALYTTPLLVHQTFRLRISQIQPDRRESAGQLEIWSDSGGRRFASRLQDAGGSLRHAVWRSEPGHEYSYNSKLAPTVVSLKKTASNQARLLTDLSGSAATLESLESGLVDWIETRQWRPIGASAELNSFVTREGAILRAERDGPRICLQAERRVGAARIEVSFELDSVSYATRLQKIRFEKSGHIVELELIPGKCEFMNSARLTTDVFEPEKNLVPSLARVVSHEPVIRNSEPQEVVSDPEPLDFDPLEIEVQYAMHRAKACLGEPVEVVAIIGKNGQPYVEVRGVVETQQRKKQLQDALAGLTSVHVDIRTAEDAIRETHRDFKEPITSESEIGIRLSSTPSAIEAALEEFFANHKQNTASPRQEIAGFSTQAVSLSQSSLSHAWALRRLAERYGIRKKSDLLPRSRWLLEVMIRDHIAALQLENQRIRALLDPLLLHLEAKSDGQPTSSAPLDQNAPDWRSLSLSLFATSEQIDTLVRALFAASYPPQPREVEGQDRAESAHGAVTALMGALQRLEVDLVGANQEAYKIIPD